VPPLAARWNVAVDARQVLAADGRAYVLVAGGVAALDQTNGRQLWAAALPASSAGAGYEAGALFVAAGNEVVSLDAASGGVRWRRDLGAAARTPVVSGGAVYATHEGGELVALKASDGAELWRRPGVAGAEAPALDGGRAYVSGRCGEAAALTRADGAEAWRRAGDCTTGSPAGTRPEDPGRTVAPALSTGRLYVPADGAVLGAGGGAVEDRFAGSRPVFADGLSIQPEPTAVQAVDPDTGRRPWRVTGGLDDALAVGHDVFGFRGDRLVALATDDGRVLWSDGRVVGDAGRSLAVAPGLLLVAGEGRLVAYQSALRPSPREVAVGVDRDEVPAGTSFALVGVLGRELRGAGATVRIEGADWPRGRYGRVSDVRAARDGGFLGGVALYRSSRFRVRSGRGLSRPITVYAIPRVRLGSPRRASRGRIAVAASVRTPRTRLDGLRLHLYLRRAGAKRLERVGTGRLRRAGSGRTKATLRFTAPRRTTRGDTLDFCIEKQLRLGLGKPSPLTRRCGERRLPA
jgi:outer membrane protein assembly factor BamB